MLLNILNEAISTSIFKLLIEEESDDLMNAQLNMERI
ncbi:hypothetical protein HCAG_07167 [Histoplasma mississippiense (nom. inval.)]|nr:hypothetical protein HCAG_07167 [Histoplasma mississippiense (nom. inval.)]EDN10706.1 hypothetical protein HCAG_07167 [Histoplasma mississippiense (nom. inval.)]